MSQTLHIISFDVPYPPNYGGVIDVFNKIKALYEAGAEIHLHCYLYRGKSPAPELKKYCRAVHYYPRKLHFYDFLSARPFIVQTRRPSALLRRLQEQPYPILFEGLHTCAFVDHPSLRERRKLVRMHNVEWQYYRHLAGLERNVKRKFFLYSESLKLWNFEPRVLATADVVFPISAPDKAYFAKRYHGEVKLLPAFHGYDQVQSKAGKGDYALFHGNLSVPDNERAARLLIEKVFSHLDYPLRITGRSPSSQLQALCDKYLNVELIPDPEESSMEELIQNAQLHLLYSQQSQGIKIKLLHALFLGRHVIANEHIVAGTGLRKLCRVANSPEEMREATWELQEKEFTAHEVEKRRQFLAERYSDRRGAEEILNCLGIEI